MKARKLATISNFIYAVATIVHIYHGSVVAIPLALLTFGSAYYHYLYAREHAGLNVSTKALGTYQRLDVAAIYLVIGMYPFQLAGDLWALFFIPCATMAIQKMMSDWPWDSHKLIAVLSVVVFAVAYFHRPGYMVAGALAFMVLAMVVSVMADHMLRKGNAKGYDRLHSHWHYYTGIAFIILV